MVAAMTLPGTSDLLHTPCMESNSVVQRKVAVKAHARLAALRTQARDEGLEPLARELDLIEREVALVDREVSLGLSEYPEALAHAGSNLMHAVSNSPAIVGAWSLSVRWVANDLLVAAGEAT